MLQSRFHRAVIGAVFAAVTAFGAARPAQAAVYTGNWDPAFGPAFPQLGWKGQGTFFIPDACLSVPGPHANAGVCAGMKLVSAAVDFYNLADPLHTTLETLHFNVESMLVSEMTVGANHQMAGVVGTFGYYVPSNLNIAGGPGVTFALGFLDDVAQLGYFSQESGFGSSDLNPAGGAPFITFTPAVPEPGTYALFLAGLAVMWQIRRRRR